MFIVFVMLDKVWASDMHVYLCLLLQVTCRVFTACWVIGPPNGRSPGSHFQTTPNCGNLLTQVQF